MTSGPEPGGLRPRPRIDHVMVLVDERVLLEAASNPLVEERLGRVRRKVADSSVAGPYSTLGVAGHHTLVELFGAALPAESPLTGGLVLSFEEPGSSQAAHALLDAAGVRHQHQPVTRAAEDTGLQQPWSQLINADLGEGSRLLLFLNEVHPAYFASLGAVPAPDGSLRRGAYLDAVLGSPAGERLLRDITGVTLAVTAERARRLAAVLGVLGYELLTGGASPVLRGEDFDIVLDIHENARERVEEIRLELTRDIPDDLPDVIPFGPSSRLVFDRPGGARWIFDESV
jgi:hypothetical protein